MPVIDMPLEKLIAYEGVNPRPIDFDEFWDKSIAEMKTLDPKVEIIPANFKCPYADCYDLYFIGTFDTRIHAKLVKPKKTEGKMPAVLHFHGYGATSSDWLSYCAYAAAGYVIAGLESRGQGGASDDNCPVTGNTLEGFITKGLLDEPEKLYFRNAFLDTALLARIVMDMPEVDENRVGAFGGSQGGALTIACAALEPRIKRAVPWYPFLCDYKRVWELDLDVDAYKDLRLFFRQWDPRHEQQEKYFTKLGYIDLQFLAPRIKADVLMFTGLIDNICPPSTQFAAFNKMTCKKEVKIYPDFGHEYLPESVEMTFEFLMGL